MLAPNALRNAFRIYWNEMDRCISGRAYWALLHVTVCLPDICAALQSDDGETRKPRYIDWCDAYLQSPFLTGAERYRMRCKVLHQGRAATDEPSGRYVGFSFGQPAANGQVDHNRVDNHAKALNLDVGCLAREVREGVERWIDHIEANRNTPAAVNVERNLPALVQVREIKLLTTTAQYGVVPPLTPTSIWKSS